jgi:hypothetical protein
MHAPETSGTVSTREHHRSKLRRSRRLKIMQDQVGHAYASTTAIYTGVSDAYRNRLLVRSLQQRHGDLWEANR